VQSATANLFGHGAMLVVDAFSKRILTFWIEGQQINVVIGAPMQDAAAAINGGVDQGVRGAAILGLHVIDGLVNLYVRVMPEEHML
jgi:hypothetical protein